MCVPRGRRVRHAHRVQTPLRRQHEFRGRTGAHPTHGPRRAPEVFPVGKPAVRLPGEEIPRIHIVGGKPLRIGCALFLPVSNHTRLLLAFSVYGNTTFSHRGDQRWVSPADRVVIPVRGKYFDLEVNRFRGGNNLVSDSRFVTAIGHPHPTLNNRVGKTEPPHRQTVFQPELSQNAKPLRRDRAVRPHAGGQIKPAPAIHHAFVNVRYANGPSHRWFRSSDQESMVHPRTAGGDRARGVPAHAVGYQPVGCVFRAGGHNGNHT